MPVSVALNTPLAETLSNVVQPKLVEVGWSTGGLDDSALAEYIILMLVNGKTQDQIASELSNDLLNLGPDDSGATDFAKWLFEQVEVLSNPAPTNSTVTQHPELQTSLEQDVGRESKESGGSGSQDAEMSEAMEVVQEGAIPTGPKSMRNGGRPANRRIMGQISKAMDRSQDSALHRIRPQQGTERINMHNRQPPKGPRGDLSRGRIPNGGIPSGPSNGAAQIRGPTAGINQMTAQQQMQLLAMYEQQARMMSEILGPQGQQMLMPQMSMPAINPAFRNGVVNQPQQHSRSLFQRTEGRPQRLNVNGNYRKSQPNGNQAHSGVQQDTNMGNSDISSSMEVESSQDASSAKPPSETVCKFNLKCAKADCPFVHQSPAAPPGTVIDVSDRCPFGAACQNRKCVGSHPSPAQKQIHQSEQDCKFFPNCTNPKCPFRHPTMPMCRDGADCKKEGCKFTHVRTKCKFNPCLNPNCPYKHDEGQKRGAFTDKVWIAEGSQEREHVSERKFVAGEDGDEELIVPEVEGMGANQSSVGPEIVT